MQINNLKRVHSNTKSVSVGRGGKRGKTSGRGMKGQNSRAGRKKRPEMRDFIKRLPKLRGYAFNMIGKKPVALNVGVLDKAFKAGETVTIATLIEKGILGNSEGKERTVKILAGGEITKKLTIEAVSVSNGAKEKIEKAGGSIK